MKYKIISALIIISTILVSLVFSFLANKAVGDPEQASWSSGSGSAYSYGSCFDKSLTLSADGSVLYVAYEYDGLIARVNANTMSLIDTISLESDNHPHKLLLSPDESHIYVVCSAGGPGKIAKINLSTLQQQYISLDSDPVDIAQSSDGSKLLIAYRTYPYWGDGVADMNEDAPLNSGRLALIDPIQFTISTSIDIVKVPYSLWFSDSTNRAFVEHASYNATIDWSQGWSDTIEQWERITTYDVDRSIVPLGQEIKGGGRIFFTPQPPYLVNWTDSGSQMLIPNPWPERPPFSFRIADTNTFATTDYTFTDVNDNPMGVYRACKVPGQDTVWAIIAEGSSQPGNQPHPAYIVAKIPTSGPMTVTCYPVNECTGFLGDIAVSPDGDTLYLSDYTSNQIIKWTPDN
jgi:DNA-binding beta-propeller fold protein YncE